MTEHTGAAAVVGRRVVTLSLILLHVTAAAAAQQPPSAASPLAGTSWQLVRFQGGDGKELTPDDRSKYTIAFDKNGNLTARIDCNRGRGTWSSSGPGSVHFSPMGLTRAMCPPGSLHDQIARQWTNIRSYVVKGGHLFLSLMADGGIYEFEPAATQTGSFKSPVASKGPATWTCGQGTDTLRVTFYETQPPMVLLERAGVTRPAFQVKSASGARFEGDGIQFWEARGEATLTWMGTQSICKPQ
jgi:heat shock protein HslJ/membrane-bound inhibitor of C-type lysozyme